MFIQLLIGAIMLGGIYGLLGLGYGIIYKTSGLLTFAQGEVLMIGAFLGYTFFKLFHMPFLVALLATVVIMFVFGFVFEKTIIRTRLSVLRRSCAGLSQGYTRLLGCRDLLGRQHEVVS